MGKTVTVTRSRQETEALGFEFANRVKGGQVIAMKGDLGAGKTCFTSGFARGMGYDGEVNSPTFAIVNEYLGDIPLFHFDMYRLGDAEELFEIGWEDYLDRGGVCAVEWSENVEGAFPPETIVINIRKTGDCDREIDITIPDGRRIEE